MKENFRSVLMALFVALFIITTLGFILESNVMGTTGLCILTAITGGIAGIQVSDFLSSSTVGEYADVKRNRILLLLTIVEVVVFLALLSLMIFQLCGELF